MSSAFKEKIFKGKTFSNLLEEIYTNQKKREAQITALISELKPLVQDIGDATLIVPLIKEYLDLGVKNDEALIKMATIIQRIVTSNGSSSNDGLIISDEEKEQLMNEVNKLKDKDEEK